MTRWEYMGRNDGTGLQDAYTTNMTRWEYMGRNDGTGLQDAYTTNNLSLSSLGTLGLLKTLVRR
jgi:hypothetical protein